MKFLPGNTFQGSLALHDAFKLLAPKGLVLEIVHHHAPTIYYADGKYLYRSAHVVESMDGAWYALKNAANEFKVIKAPSHRYSTSKALHD